MPYQRPEPERDGITIARLHGAAKHHATRPGDHDQGVAELREIAAGRTDLLAQVCGILRAGHQHDPQIRGHWDGPAAELLWQAGAHLDPEAVEQWTVIGRQRATPPPPPRLYRDRPPGG